MSVDSARTPGEPGMEDAPEVAPAPPLALNPYDPAKAWVFGLLVSVLVAGQLGGISQYFGMVPALVVSLLVVRRGACRSPTSTG